MPHPAPPTTVAAPSRRRALAVVVAAGVLALGFGGRMELLRLAATARVVAEGGHFLGRKGVALQRSAHDCGPAALSTLLGLAGGPPVTLDSIGRLAGTTIGGTTAAGLIEAARELGLPLAFRHLPALPKSDAGFFIAWVRSRHFVVARALPDGRVLVLDPQVGRYLLASDRFEGIWSGESLVAAAAVPASRPPSGSDSPARILAIGRLP